MHGEKAFRDRCRARGLDEPSTDTAISRIAELEAAAAGSDGTLATAPLAAVERHLEGLASRGEAGEDLVMAYARYFTVIGNDGIAIRLLAYLNPVGVIPAHARRLAALEGSAVRDRVMAGICVPPPGSRPEAYPAAAAAFVRALEAELGSERARRVLAWNVHGIPVAAFADEREFFLAAKSIEEWLEGYHARQVETLARHAADGTLWFEQRITPRVVGFVRDHPEVLGGVRDGDIIHETKIPYDPDRWLVSEDRTERRRLACHCPLAASTIDGSGAGVPAAWCACSAGYEKFKYDVVFGVETEALVLESVIAGDERCRFAIRIPGQLLKTGSFR
ncbi:MAG: hypothetical protein NT080_04950 [Spirochaetes bacterium]|nr:hypothetical protein [Spirochaetota bacterium]